MSSMRRSRRVFDAPPLAGVCLLKLTADRERWRRCGGRSYARCVASWLMGLGMSAGQPDAKRDTSTAQRPACAR